MPLSELANFKVFSNPALDIMWCNAGHVKNVLRFLPHGAWDGIDEDSAFHKPLVHSDWDRVRVYSGRVKFFRFDQTLYKEKALETLRVCFPGQHLFPNIETLEWHVENEPELIPHVLLFLGPRLTTLSLSLDTIPHLSLLATVAKQCPSLTHVGLVLSIALENDNIDHFRSVSWFLRSLKHLEDVTVPSLDRAALHYIAELPTVPILEYLYMTGNKMNVLSGIITLLKHAPITCIAATRPKRTISDKIAQLYVAVVANCSRSSLSELLLSSESSKRRVSGRASTARDWISSLQLRPLFAFSNLTHVKLSAPAGFALDDATVADMARGWPRIEILGLSSMEYAHVQSTVTLGALMHFARHCPNLWRLNLFFDATAPVPELQAGNQRLRQQHLESLDVCRSPVATPLAVAGFLSRVFPKLMSVGAHWGNAYADDDVHKDWLEVNKVLPALQKARAEEQEYWARREQS
ncbi:hypothetical protein DFH08DRAFT_1080011 [Mycena albidolilacea]|uniref:Uncharacterized protein n=1 Tax=Mycena albidolilacea TaxID=1033008 RepID=A0AAD7A4B7_9AGAR|nr:hypothetical protein DFH08DRAFT_1080011 [Mycena albidolilacea]